MSSPKTLPKPCCSSPHPARPSRPATSSTWTAAWWRPTRASQFRERITVEPGLLSPGRGHVSPFARWRGLALDAVSLSGGFWASRQRVNREVSLAHGFRMLEQAGNLGNLQLAAGAGKGPYQGPVFMDSDVYKWLEAVAYAGA